MAHRTARGGYGALVGRLNRFPQGAPPSRHLDAILRILCSEGEARLLAALPLRPFSCRRAAAAWNTPVAEAANTLDGLASRGLLLDLEKEGEMLYLLPPPMAGFFEFSLMRVRPDLDQQALSALLYRYINVEDDFVRELFAAGETQLGRVLVHEPSLPPEGSLEILDYERATEVIRSATDVAVGLCYCRHKMSHLSRACDAPLDNCMTLNLAAKSLIRHGHARRAEPAEALDLLREAWSLDLVQCADNVRNGVNFICNCCRCCCEGLLAARRLALAHPLYTTNFLPRSVPDRCSGCGACARICPMDALEVGGGRPVLQAEICLGCGLCVKACRFSALELERRGRRVVTPVNTAHRVVLMAIERGKLPELIFDGHGFGYRGLAAILGVILRLPPAKQLLACRQVKSRYLERLLEKVQVTDGAHL